MPTQTTESPVTPQLKLPEAPASEAAYLGAMLTAGVDAAHLLLDPDEFFQERHRAIYTAAMARLLSDQPLDAALIGEDLRVAGSLALIGGQQYLDALEEKGRLVDSVQADEHAKTLRRLAECRRIIEDAQKAAHLASTDTPEAALKVLSQTTENSAARLRAGLLPRYSTDEALDDKLGRIEWLWPGYVLKGFVTAVVGPQEAGKSNLCLDLCNRLLQGQNWPDHAESPRLADDQKLLWIDTEMALAAFVERLEMWQAPRGRFILPEDPLRQLQLDNPADWQWIEGAITHIRPPLVVIDSLSGGHRSEEKDNDAMKTILLRLSLLAQTHKIAVIVIHHLRKAGIGEPDFPVTIDRVRGASAITQFCRSILALGIPDKTQPDLRRVDVIKSNFSRARVPLGYQITDNGLAWGAAPEPPKSANPIEGARTFLLDILNNGPRPSKDVYDAAEAEGISRRTLERAKQDLSLKAIPPRGSETRWFWALPHKTSWSKPEEE